MLEIELSSNDTVRYSSVASYNSKKDRNGREAYNYYLALEQ